MTHTKKIRRYIIFFVVALVLSGITAFPLETELQILTEFNTYLPDSVGKWLNEISTALVDTNRRYPYLAYGTDWLAFAHIVIAVGFIGPYRDPVRNKWVIIHAMIACVLIWPLAFIMGPIRDIPFHWTLIDCSFGILGLIPLGLCLREINSLEQNQLLLQSESPGARTSSII